MSLLQPGSNPVLVWSSGAWCTPSSYEWKDWPKLVGPGQLGRLQPWPPGVLAPRDSPIWPHCSCTGTCLSRRPVLRLSLSFPLSLSLSAGTVRGGSSNGKMRSLGQLGVPRQLVHCGLGGWGAVSLVTCWRQSPSSCCDIFSAPWPEVWRPMGRRGSRREGPKPELEKRSAKALASCLGWA